MSVKKSLKVRIIAKRTALERIHATQVPSEVSISMVTSAKKKYARYTYSLPCIISISIDSNYAKLIISEIQNVIIL
jgi:hypothetical protein